MLSAPKDGALVKIHREIAMPRLTITFSEKRHRTLKEAAARKRKSIATIIEGSLELSGGKTIKAAADLVARARSGLGVDDAGALKLEVDETRAQTLCCSGKDSDSSLPESPFSMQQSKILSPASNAALALEV